MFHYKTGHLTTQTGPALLEGGLHYFRTYLCRARVLRITASLLSTPVSERTRCQPSVSADVAQARTYQELLLCTVVPQDPRCNLPIEGIIPDTTLTPGPAEYSLPPTFGYNIPDKPASSAAVITGRPKTPGSMNNRSPGPAVYGVPKMNVYKKKIPTFSILGKSNSGLPVNCSPGPNAYCPEKSTLWKSGAKISFGQRHSKKCATLRTEQDKN
uniref:Uncharacterized protein n=1 Tax=Timema shepardi TaxID=629360 RepID=A0A7R9FXH8_TIMSH|nr:unnamed protein product [Timema shepardi]